MVCLELNLHHFPRPTQLELQNYQIYCPINPNCLHIHCYQQQQYIHIHAHISYIQNFGRMTAECGIGHKHTQYARHKELLLIYKYDTRIQLKNMFC
jgi:hypothetical protein